MLLLKIPKRHKEIESQIIGRLSPHEFNVKSTSQLLEDLFFNFLSHIKGVFLA